MGQGTYANHADTVEKEFLEQICPDEWKALINYLKKEKIDYDSFGAEMQEYYQQGDFTYNLDGDMSVDEDPWKTVLELYTALVDVFEKKTKLTLSVRYHDREDRGDEVDGAFWEVEGVYTFTPAGEKYKDKIERKFWTTWG